VLVGGDRASFVVDKQQLMAWDPKDYPADDVQSQKAPGGTLNAKALEDMKSGSAH